MAPIPHRGARRGLLSATVTLAVVSGLSLAAPASTATTTTAGESPRIDRQTSAAAAAPVATAPSAVAKVRPGNYRGKTQGHYDLRFAVRAKPLRITGWSTAVVAYCTDSSGTQPLVKYVRVPKFPIPAGGKIKHTYRAKTANGKLTVTLAGRVSAGRLRNGTMAYRLRGSGAGGNFVCVTDGPQRVTARRVG